MNPIFQFKTLENEHLDLLCKWFKNSHIKEWWNDALTDDEIKSKYGERIGNSLILPFIAYLDEKPIGFIQYYYANKLGQQWWQDEMEGTVGIDQFIGEEEYINRGYCTQMIGQFIAKIFTDSKIIKIITDVDANNHRAIRCYEKLGFCLSHSVTTPEGKVNLMTMHKNTSIEPHAAFLKKPTENTLLYKIVLSKNFAEMIENNYLYFKKVDTYDDDKRDSDQPEKDKAISRETKFLYAPDTGVDTHYNACRSRTYACCLSTENTSHLWEHYAENDTDAVCLIFNCHKLINFINMTYNQSILTYGNNKLDNFFDINYGLVSYGDFDDGYLEHELPNPIEYVYFKDAGKYQEEKEFRISLSCLGLHKIPKGFIFADSIKLSFDFAEAISQNVLIRIELHAPHDKMKVKDTLNSLLSKKGITAKFIDEILE